MLTRSRPLAPPWPESCRDLFADYVRNELHSAWNAGMARGEARAGFHLLLAAMAPRWPTRPMVVVNVELLRSALGDGERAITRLEALLATQLPEKTRRRVLVELLQMYQVHQDVRRGWPQFDRFEAEQLASAPPNQVFEFHRHRTALRTQIGTIDAAEAAWTAATKALAALPEAERTAQRQLLLHLAELDLWLAAEHFEDAEAVVAKIEREAPADGPAARRAALGRALIRVRTGRVDEALPLLAAAAARGGPTGMRAAAELSLLRSARGDLAGARSALHVFGARPLRELGAVELVAVARTCMLAAAQREQPLHALADVELALQAELDRTLARWGAVPATATGVPFLFLAGRRDLLATLAAMRIESRGPEAGLQLLLDTEAMGSTARTLGARRPDLAAIRSHLLPENGLLLAWLPAPTESFVFGVTAGDCFAVPLPSDAGLRDKVRALLRITADEPSPRWQERLHAAGRAVAGWCLPPAVEQRLRAHHHVAIVGRDLTAGIPFEALPFGAEGLELGAAKAIWSLPSMTLACHYAGHYAVRPAMPRQHAVAVLAATAVAATEQAAFGTKPIAPDPKRWATWSLDESRRGAVIAPASATDLLRDAGANARVTVVLAHGVRDLTTGRPNGVQMGPRADGRGTVLADDIIHAADVVLLLACSPGAGAPRRGEDGGHHLGGALLRHGAHAVVLANHELELASTLHWAGEFLAAWRTGADAAEAARRARLAVRSKPEWRHPWFHASLRVEGLGHHARQDCGPLR